MRSIFSTYRKPQTSVFLLFLFLIFSLYIVALMTNSIFLPPKFENDADTIRLLIHGQIDQVRTIIDGFRNTALIYRILGAETFFPEWLIIIITNIAYWFAALKVLDNSALHRQNFFIIIFCFGWIFCTALFLSRYSKEMVALIPLFFICFSPLKTPLQKILTFSVPLFYVLFFRQYWALSLALYFGFYYLFFRFNATAAVKLILMIAFYFSPFLFNSIFRASYLTDWRVIANLDSFDPNRAHSAIDNLLINSGPFTDYINALYGWLYLNIPIKLFFSDVFYYKAFALFQLGSVAILFSSIYAEITHRHERRINDDPFYSRCLSFVLAYSLTQAIFEPDVGSFLRHQIILTVPLIYILYPKRIVCKQIQVELNRACIPAS